MCITKHNGNIKLTDNGKKKPTCSVVFLTDRLSIFAAILKYSCQYVINYLIDLSRRIPVRHTHLAKIFILYGRVVRHFLNHRNPLLMVLTFVRTNQELKMNYVVFS